MTERMVLVGVLPAMVALDGADYASWYAEAGTLRVEFDPQRSPFASNVFQAPAGVRVQSGPVRPGANPGSYKYRLFLNDQPIGQGEILVRGK